MNFGAGEIPGFGESPLVPGLAPAAGLFGGFGNLPPTGALPGKKAEAFSSVTASEESVVAILPGTFDGRDGQIQSSLGCSLQ